MYIIPKVAPKTISKANGKSNAKTKTFKVAKTNANDQKRLQINQRERQRTSTMNEAFKNLKDLFNSNKDFSKIETLEMTNKYIYFLYNMANSDDFFNKYRNNPIHIAFQIYMVETQLLN